MSNECMATWIVDKDLECLCPENYIRYDGDFIFNLELTSKPSTILTSSWKVLLVFPPLGTNF